MENLPSFLSLGKALLILFVEEEEGGTERRENEAVLEEMRRAVEMGGDGMERYLACWIHLCVDQSAQWLVHQVICCPFRSIKNALFCISAAIPRLVSLSWSPT